MNRYVVFYAFVDENKTSSKEIMAESKVEAVAKCLKYEGDYLKWALERTMEQFKDELFNVDCIVHAHELK